MVLLYTYRFLLGSILHFLFFSFKNLSLGAVTCIYMCVCKLWSLCVLVNVCCVSLDTGCVGRVGTMKDL